MDAWVAKMEMKKKWPRFENLIALGLAVLAMSALARPPRSDLASRCGPRRTARGFDEQTPRTATPSTCEKGETRTSPSSRDREDLHLAHRQFDGPLSPAVFSASTDGACPSVEPRSRFLPPGADASTSTRPVKSSYGRGYNYHWPVPFGRKPDRHFNESDMDTAGILLLRWTSSMPFADMMYFHARYRQNIRP
jgi:hypothetical protein